MQRKLSILLFICCFNTCFYSAYSQTFYANTGSSVNKITVTSGGCNVSTVSFPCALDFFSIAISGDTLYFYTSAKNALYRTFLSKPYVCEEVLQMPLVNALTVGKDGIIYAAQDNTLSKINPYTKQKTDYTIPFRSAGDLLFYNGKLYLAAEPNYIVQVDLDSTTLSTIYFQVNEPQVYGLTSVSGSCTENKVFALATNGVSTDLIELDMDNAKSLGIRCTLPGEYYDAASNTESGRVTGIVIDSIVTRNICVGSVEPSFLKVYASGIFGTLTYTLNNGLSNTTGDFENIAEGNYSIRIAVNDSCYKDTSASIVKGSCNVLLPTAFTPNGDGRNDVFRPLGITPTGDILFVVYDRWGQKIFETKNYAQGWDGTANGKKVPPGTYVYMLRFKDANNTLNFKKGTVILLR